MKKILFLFVIATVGVLFSASAIAQEWQSKPDLELTKEEATLKIQQYEGTVSSLDAQIKAIDAEIDKLKKQLDNINASIKDCNKSLYTMIGATEADVENFRQKLGVVEGKIRDMKRLPDDVLADKQDEVKILEDQLNELRGVKIAVLPEFYNRIISDARDIKGLYREKQVKSYTVGTWAKDKDCLWNIAGKIDIYGDPLLWPKIWQANTKEIRNPDIIFPGQQLQLLPAAPKTSDEIKAERKYWRHKREAQAAAGETTDKTTKKTE